MNSFKPLYASTTLFLVFIFTAQTRENDIIFNNGFEVLPLQRIGVLTTGTNGQPVSETVLNHPNLDGFLIHQAWKDSEIQKGVFDWTYIDSQLASAVTHNKKVRMALHIGGDDAPKWLYDDNSIPFVLGKSGALFNHTNELSFNGSTLSISANTWPGDLRQGKIIEINGTDNNNGRYRLISDTTNSITVEEVFITETNASGTITLDVVPSYWHAAVIQHKSDFYNALIAHTQSLGNESLEALLTFSVSLVDPNTGDWSFVNSPEHIDSYNTAGWLTGNDAEKQAGWDMFHDAMIMLYDNVLPNTPSSMFAGSAVGPVPGTLLPIGTDRNKPAQDILDYVEINYPNKVIIAKGALNARTYFNWPCPAISSTWFQICNKPLQNFLQINWSASSPSFYSANGNHQWDKSNFSATAAVLKNAGLSAYSYNALWFEIWHDDVDGNVVSNNSELQDKLNESIAYITDLFHNGNVVIDVPIAIQIPDATINAATGTPFVLEYVFDYNGEVPDLFEVKKDGVIVGNDLSYTLSNPTTSDSGIYEISCGNSAGITTISTQITFN